MADKKKVSIRVLSGCRVAGKSLTAGKVYAGLEYDEAKFAVSAGRAVYETAAKKSAKKPAANSGDSK